MSLTAGIVGLPNVGKSTLFSAITNSDILAQNYPFATINPNVGVVEVKDERIDRLSEIFIPKRIVRTTFEFTDIAGLIKGASKGEGLGNQFLGNIRNTNAIIHVVRCFDDESILTYNGRKVAPVDDVLEVELELIYSDIEVVNKRLEKIERKAMTTKDKESLLEVSCLHKLLDGLQNETLASAVPLTFEENEIAKGFNLITMKPIIYVANIDEDSYADPLKNPHYAELLNFATSRHTDCIPVSAKIEEELSRVSEEDRMAYLESLGTSKTGLDKITFAAYHILGLRTFFTCGSDEVRAWTFKDGYTAKECAGVIHSDFEKFFLKAEVYTYDDLLEYGSELAVREKGKMLTVGKDYLVKDGDILFIRSAAKKK